jgi:hypothetical protein
MDNLPTDAGDFNTTLIPSEASPGGRAMVLNQVLVLSSMDIIEGSLMTLP